MRPIPSGPRDYNTNYGRPPPPSQPYSQQMYNPEAPLTGHYNGNQMRPPMSGPPPNVSAGGNYAGRPQAPPNATPMVWHYFLLYVYFIRRSLNDVLLTSNIFYRVRNQTGWSKHKKLNRYE